MMKGKKQRSAYRRQRVINKTTNKHELITESDCLVEPFIPSSVSLPEITPRAILLGILLAIIFAASSTYLGLKIARTIAASIPAALISMVILRQFRNANILENNMVQTIASAGEAVATGVIFTLPALIIIGYWQSFDYLQTVMITLIGGILGVVFSVPLRRSMVVKENLPYPEGVATGEILKAGEETKKGSIKVLIIASLFSTIISLLQNGFKIIGEQIQYWTKVGTTAIGGSLILSPVLMAAGYIVGIRGLVAFGIGGLLTWGLAIPLFVTKYGLPEARDIGSALAIVQKLHFRYVGVGVLVVGGLWSIVSIAKQIKEAFTISFTAMKAHRSEFAKILRTDRDLPFKYVLLAVAVIAIPTFILFFTLVDSAHLELQDSVLWGIVIFATVFSLLVGFIASAIAAYIVGIVGTTSLPVSGISIAAIIGFSSLLLLMLGSQIDFTLNTTAALKVTAIVIVFASIIAVASMVSGDNMQDLKAGQLVGATPWKQQLMLAIGAIAAALIIPFILQTTFQAYGIGEILPRPGMNPEQALPAPQATLIATIAKGFFVGHLPWGMIKLGISLGIIVIILDEYLKYIKSPIRFPALLFALGIYLPLGYVTAFLIGGFIHALVHKKQKPGMIVSETNPGILCASGIIAGEAILGALLTIPFAYYQSTDVLALNKIAWLAPIIAPLVPFENWLAVILYVGLCAYLYKQAVKKG
jgi:putative OPT family oligopeptide transporter